MSVYNNSNPNYKYMLISEAYIGKTKTLLEIESQIGIIREKCTKRFSDINKTKEVLSLNRLFESQFGMELFSLHVDKSNQINAYTMPVGVRYDVSGKLSNMVIGDKVNGYRFKPNNGLCIICTINFGLLNNPNFTNAEILAVILHELGHNFSDAICNNIELANVENKNAMLNLLIHHTYLSFIYYKLYYENASSAIIKKEKNTKKKPMKAFIDGIKASMNDFGDYLFDVINRLGGGANIIKFKIFADKNNVSDYMSKSNGRQDEVIADRFAGIYGYGPEQASALLKMEKEVSRSEKTVNKIPGIGMELNEDYNDAVKDIYRYDVHPHVIQRINEEIKVLKLELAKSDLDPRLVKAMQEQLKQLEKIKEETLALSNKLNSNDKMRVDFYNYVENNDPDALDEELTKEIEQAFDNILDGKKR